MCARHGVVCGFEFVLEKEAVRAAGVCAPEKHHHVMCLFFLLPSFVRGRESERELGTGAKSKLGLGANNVYVCVALLFRKRERSTPSRTRTHHVAIYLSSHALQRCSIPAATRRLDRFHGQQLTHRIN